MSNKLEFIAHEVILTEAGMEDRHYHLNIPQEPTPRVTIDVHDEVIED